MTKTDSPFFAVATCEMGQVGFAVWIQFDVEAIQTWEEQVACRVVGRGMGSDPAQKERFVERVCTHVAFVGRAVKQKCICTFNINTV